VATGGVIVAPLAIVLLTLEPSGETTRLQIDASFVLDARTMSSTPPPMSPPSGRWIGEAGEVRATVFHRPIVDDDAPPALQPFLQQPSSFSVEAGAGGADIIYPVYAFSSVDPSAFFIRYRSLDRSVNGSASADVRLSRWVRLAAHLGVAYDSWEPNVASQTIGGFGNVTPISSGTVGGQFDSSELAFDASVSVGLRLRNLLVATGWNVTPVRVGGEALHVRFWANAFVDLRAVFRRRFDLTAHVAALDAGAAGNADFVAWLRRRWGVGFGLEGGHGGFADSSAHYDRAGGHVAISAWVTPRIAITLRYAAAWQSTTPVPGFGFAYDHFSFVQHVVTLSLTARPRTR
jgi:hypothetical protein